MHRTADRLSDHELVARVRAGSDDAYAIVVARYREPLVGFAAKLAGGSHADADDIVQDALIRALGALRATDRPMALRAWLYMIVRNRTVDHLRSVRARRIEGDEQLALVAAPEHTGPAERALAREELDRVVEELGRLPERQRLAVVRHELGGVAHRDLAAQMGTSVAATKSLLVRARSTLAAGLAA